MVSRERDRTLRSITRDAEELLMTKAQYEVFELSIHSSKSLRKAYADSSMAIIISMRLPKTHSSSSAIASPVGL